MEEVRQIMSLTDEEEAIVMEILRQIDAELAEKLEQLYKEQEEQHE